MKCYKVTTYNLQTCAFGIYAHTFIVQYKLGEFVEAAIPGTPLLVFSDLDKALSKKSLSQRVWECECEEEMKLPEYRMSVSARDSDSRYFWSLYSDFGRIDSDIPPRLEVYKGWPEHTLGFRRVKLLKEI